MLISTSHLNDQELDRRIIRRIIELLQDELFDEFVDAVDESMHEEPSLLVGGFDWLDDMEHGDWPDALAGYADGLADA